MKTLNCQDLEDNGILNELASVFNKDRLARALLGKIGFPKSRVPLFETPVDFWWQICSELESGLIAGGPFVLINAAAHFYPYNIVFGRFIEKNTSSDNGNIVSNVGMQQEPGKEIFISYAWGGESEQITDKLDAALQQKGIIIVRDKRDLGFKGSIKKFMDEIGKGKCVIVVISNKYLESENCMYELIKIAKYGNFYDRIFPIVLVDAQIFKPVERLKYIKYWEEKISELDEAMKGVSAANLQGFREDIDLYTEIRNTVSELTNILKDMNVLTPEIHEESGFNAIIEAIEEKMTE